MAFLKLLINKKKRKGNSILVLTFSVIAIIILLEITVDMGIMLNCRYQLQKAVELTALTTISEFEPYETTSGFASPHVIMYPQTTKIIASAIQNFNNIVDSFVKLNSPILASATITPSITFTTASRHSRAILIEADAVINTYFLRFFGIKTLKFEASAAAANVPEFIDKDSFMSGPSVETFIRNPSGRDENILNVEGINVTMPPTLNVNENFSGIIGPPDGRVLSLGAGGYVTIKLPKPVTAGSGFDLMIHTRGPSVGYFVFLGNDIDHEDPYINSDNPGAGINWVNISCTAVPVNVKISVPSVLGPKQGFHSYYQLIFNGGIASTWWLSPKTYGSNYFELDSVCRDNSGNVIYDGSDTGTLSIKSAKYLAIADDFKEDGFEVYDPAYFMQPGYTPIAYKRILPPRLSEYAKLFSGEHSSITPGVDIDSVMLLHNPVLISKTDFNAAKSANGMIPSVQSKYGYHVSDYVKFWGCSEDFTFGNWSWNNCFSILNDNIRAETLIMGHSSPDFNSNEDYSKMIIDY